MEIPTLAVAGKKAERSFDLSKVFLFGPSILAIAISLLIAFLVVWPRFGEAQRLKVSNKTLEETAVKLEAKAEALSRLDQDQLKTQLTAAEQLLPSEKGIFTFIRQIENVRNGSGVVITNLSVGSVGQFSTGSETTVGDSQNGAPVPPPSAPPAAGAQPDLGDVSKVTMKVTLTSDFDQIFGFLNQLYALPRVTTVSGLSFSLDQGGLIGTTMDINSLWQELPSELPSVEAPLATISEPEAALLKKVESEGSVASPVVVPDVPKGKTNIFATN